LRKLENKQDKFNEKNLIIKTKDYIPKKLDEFNMENMSSPKVYATSYDSGFRSFSFSK
jgi:hypothetical protein